MLIRMIQGPQVNMARYQLVPLEKSPCQLKDLARRASEIITE